MDVNFEEHWARPFEGAQGLVKSGAFRESSRRTESEKHGR
jgi:hypothetical protein